MAPKTFQLDGVGRRPRLVHFVLAALGVLGILVAGLPGLWVYLGTVMILHLRPGRNRGSSLMELYLQGRERALDRAWDAFTTSTQRRSMVLVETHSMSLADGVVAIVCFLVLAVAVTVRLAEGPIAYVVAARVVFALTAWAALWVALVGFERRTTLLFGADGVRIGEVFVSYTIVRAVTRDGARVVIDRDASTSPVVVATADAEAAARLVGVLAAEQDRAARRRAEASPPLPAAGFRQGASRVGWRAQLLDTTSREERDALLARVPPEDLRELLEETADPELEEALKRVT